MNFPQFHNFNPPCISVQCDVIFNECEPCGHKAAVLYSLNDTRDDALTVWTMWVTLELVRITI